MARSLFIPLWDLLPTSNRPMQIDCRWFLRGHLDLHSRKTVSALRQYNAPASLESSERKIKISKRLWIVEVARETAHGCRRGDHERSKETNWLGPSGLLSV